MNKIDMAAPSSTVCARSRTRGLALASGAPARSSRARSARAVSGSLAERPPSADARRLLERLAEPEACAVFAAEGGGRLAIRVRRSGITMGAGTMPAIAADELVETDCAAWSAGAGTRGRKLAITPAGLARLRRLKAPAGLGYAAQHGDLTRETVQTDDGAQQVTVNRAESPLLWLHRRLDRSGAPLIDAAAFAAGERLRADLTLARMLPRVTTDWQAHLAPGGGGGRAVGGMSDAALAASQRAKLALAAVGTEFAGLLIDVCGFLKGLEQVERERRWPARSGKLILRMALARLADHYGLAAEMRGSAGSRGIRRWSET